MASDMVVALARATLDGHTLFGHNNNRPRGEAASLVRAVGRAHAPGETVQTTQMAIPQVRQTCSVLAVRAGNDWGYQSGVNDKGVAVAWTPIRTRLLNDSRCLTGPDLVRLVLERAGTALQAMEILTDLIGRHGQGAFAGEGECCPDAALLVVDHGEAHVIEAAGRHWVLATIGSVRAVVDACLLRQDWDRISRGLSDLAIQRGWWPEDGCKLDFAGALGLPGTDRASSLRRWGRATMQLEQHSGAIDGAFLRRLLREQSEAVCPSNAPAADVQTSASLIVRLGPKAGSLPLAWCAFGAPAVSVYLPVVPVGELPAAYNNAGQKKSPLRRLASAIQEGKGLGEVRPRLEELQEQLDELTHEFLAEAGVLYEQRPCIGAGHDASPAHLQELHRLAGSFMQHSYERFEDLVGSLCPRPDQESQASEAELALPGGESW